MIFCSTGIVLVYQKSESVKINSTTLPTRSLSEYPKNILEKFSLQLWIFPFGKTLIRPLILENTHIFPLYMNLQNWSSSGWLLRRYISWNSLSYSDIWMLMGKRLLSRVFPVAVCFLIACRQSIGGHSVKYFQAMMILKTFDYNCSKNR